MTVPLGPIRIQVIDHPSAVGQFLDMLALQANLIVSETRNVIQIATPRANPTYEIGVNDPVGIVAGI